MARGFGTPTLGTPCPDPYWCLECSWVGTQPLPMGQSSEGRATLRGLLVLGRQGPHPAWVVSAIFAPTLLTRPLCSQHPTDVDYRVMATFTEFYTTLLGFVNFRLYQSLNLHYPPKVRSAQRFVPAA